MLRWTVVWQLVAFVWLVALPTAALWTLAPALREGLLMRVAQPPLKTVFGPCCLLATAPRPPSPKGAIPPSPRAPSPLSPRGLAPALRRLAPAPDPSWPTTRAARRHTLASCRFPGDIVELSRGHGRLRAGHYRLSRRLLQCSLESSDWLGAARVVPSLRSGRPNGVKIYGLSPGGQLQALGLRNGDLVLRVNGIPLSSPDRALQVYSRLRPVDAIEVELERRGQRRSLVYHLAP